MFSKFFIDHPILANVIAIVTLLMGGVALYSLPIEQYPNITPPTVKVSAVYPGASAAVVAATVAAPIEQQVNGVENMMYMSSTSASDGSYSLTVTFEVGTNVDMAQVLVQNRVAIALSSLPPEVQRQGVVTKKQSTAIIMFIGLGSPDGSRDTLFLSNYATIRLRDELSRIKGVGDVNVIPATDYSMRIWVNPDKLRARNLTAQDVIAAVQEQNVQVASGQIGRPPTASGQNFQLAVNTLGRLTDVEQFENIVVNTGSGPTGQGRITRVKDVAGVELGGQSYDQYFELDGKPAAGLAIYQLPGANALAVGDAVKKKMEELKLAFPKGVKYTIPFDTTIFVKESINEVYQTLYEAGILVILVIMIFLQDWRAVLVPASTVPVTVIGAFIAMSALGFSVNMMTLFGLILAIGIVVDDAIVIVEAAAFNIENAGMNPRDATIKAMSELLGPVIGITLVLMAVFMPAAFLPGITGQLYRQFALTIAATAVISAINAISLKPVQCATYLKKSSGKKLFFFRWFNTGYNGCEWVYTAIVKFLVRLTPLVILVFLGLVAGTGWLYTALPTGFLPAEDQGYIVVAVQLPDAASQERTHDTTDKVTKIILGTPGIAGCVCIGGQSIVDGTAASNSAAYYVTFKEWAERAKSADETQDAIIASLRRQFGAIQEGAVFAFIPPAIRGLGVSGGFQMQLQDLAGVGPYELQNMTNDIVRDANGQTDTRAVYSTYRANVPALFADVDRTKAKVLNVPLSNVFGTLQANLGSTYINDINLYGRTYQVVIQADRQFRLKPSDIKRLEVRNSNGKMVPLGTVVNVDEIAAPQTIIRYNLHPAAQINGEAAPGHSSGEALARMEKLANNKLPNTMGYEWTGMSFQEKRTGSESIYIFSLAVLLVYLVLAAQYGSWTSPAAVIFAVPLGLLGAALAVWIRGMDNNIYTQIGIVLIIALASKNAILIVEVARELRAEGHTLSEAAVEAARRRLRPILMTSFAFILGVYPLVVANGAGATSRRALGTAVFGGMIASTMLAIFFVPSFYVVWAWIGERFFKEKSLVPHDGSHKV